MRNLIFLFICSSTLISFFAFSEEFQPELTASKMIEQKYGAAQYEQILKNMDPGAIEKFTQTLITLKSLVFADSFCEKSKIACVSFHYAELSGFIIYRLYTIKKASPAPYSELVQIIDNSTVEFMKINMVNFKNSTSYKEGQALYLLLNGQGDAHAEEMNTKISPLIKKSKFLTQAIYGLAIAQVLSIVGLVFLFNRQN